MNQEPWGWHARLTGILIGALMVGLGGGIGSILDDMHVRFGQEEGVITVFGAFVGLALGLNNYLYLTMLSVLAEAANRGSSQVVGPPVKGVEDLERSPRRGEGSTSCERCDAVVVAGAAFCESCGARLTH